MTGRAANTRRRAVGVTACTIALGLLTACGMEHSNAKIWEYSGAPVDTRIELQIEIGQGDVIGDSVVQETADKVVISVPLTRPRGDYISIGYASKTFAQLRSPLGDREVVEPDGTPVPHSPNDG